MPVGNNYFEPQKIDKFLRALYITFIFGVFLLIKCLISLYIFFLFVPFDNLKMDSSTILMCHLYQIMSMHILEMRK